MIEPLTSDLATLSAECALAAKPGYKGLHRTCGQTKDIPLPHSSILLLPRCTCRCHAYNRTKSPAGS